mgnify:CR=1 FL=1
MNIYEITIPKKRVAVLIGKKGSTKRRIEKITSTKLTIDSELGLVTIKGEDSLKTYQTKSVIEAIGRGFNPNISLSLLKEDICFEIIPMQNFAGRSKNNLIRIKSRIIGTRGKCRKTIESMTDTEISIYGKTVSIIGELQNVLIAKKAVEDILAGAPHAPVYKTIELSIERLK